MPYFFKGELMTSHTEFASEVNKYSTPLLLELISLICAKYATWPEWSDPSDGTPTPPVGVSPWALAHIARTSALLPNAGKRIPMTEDVVRLCALYMHIKEPVLADPDEPDALLRLGIRLGQEQFPYQTDLATDLARMAAIVLHTTFPSHRTAKFLKSGWEQQVFGMSLKSYMNMIYTLWAFALTNHGQFRPEWLNAQEHEFLGEYFNPDSALGRFSKDWAIPLTEFAVLNDGLAQGMEDGYKKYELNPLWTRPFVGFPDGRFVAPVSQLIIRKASPTGIFYSVPEPHRNQFAVELGYLFEEYIGDTLRLIPDAQVIQEIKYNHNGGQGSCADWVIVLPEVVLVVECKAIRPRRDMIIGTPPSADKLRDAVRKGLGQVSTTLQRIDDQHPEFRMIPRDRPALGLLVTLDRHWAFDMGGGRSAFTDPLSPIDIVSSSELENLVMLDSPSFGKAFLHAMSADGLRIDRALGNADAGKNPLLRKGEESLELGKQSPV